MPRGPERAGEPHLSVAAVARMLGIAPATLRTWDRRYGIGPSAHAPGRHRRYSPEDVARLETMRHALVRGSRPPRRRATRWRRRAGGPSCGQRRRSAAGGRHDVAAAGRGAAMRAGSAGPRSRWTSRRRAPCSSRPSTRSASWPPGTTSCGPCSAPWRSGGRRPGRAWRWSTCSARASPPSSPRTTSRGPRSRTAGRSCSPAMPHEQHVLPLMVLGAALGDVGVPVRPLGGDLPAEALFAAVRRTAPAAVVLWSRPRRPPTSPCWTRCPRPGRGPGCSWRGPAGPT